MLEFKSPLSIVQSRTMRPRDGQGRPEGTLRLGCANVEAYEPTGIHLPSLGNSTPISYWRASSSSPSQSMRFGGGASRPDLQGWAQDQVWL